MMEPMAMALGCGKGITKAAAVDAKETGRFSQRFARPGSGAIGMAELQQTQPNRVSLPLGDVVGRLLAA